MEGGEFFVSTDRALLDLDFIHRFLSQESYWAKDIPYEKVRMAAEHSLNFGLYHRLGEEVRQAGYARVLTDYARIAYLADVFVDSEWRGKGLSRLLIDAVMVHPDLQTLKRWMLHTMDAHGLYRQYGWEVADPQGKYMERMNANFPGQMQA